MIECKTRTSSSLSLVGASVVSLVGSKPQDGFFMIFPMTAIAQAWHSEAPREVGTSALRVSPFSNTAVEKN